MRPNGTKRVLVDALEPVLAAYRGTATVPGAQLHAADAARRRTARGFLLVGHGTELHSTRAAAGEVLPVAPA